MPHILRVPIPESGGKFRRPVVHASEFRPFDKIWYKSGDQLVAKIVGANPGDIDVDTNTVTGYDPDGNKPQKFKLGALDTYWIQESQDIYSEREDDEMDDEYSSEEEVVAVPDEDEDEEKTTESRRRRVSRRRYESEDEVDDDNYLEPEDEEDEEEVIESRRRIRRPTRRSVRRGRLEAIRGRRARRFREEVEEIDPDDNQDAVFEPTDDDVSDAVEVEDATPVTGDGSDDETIGIGQGPAYEKSELTGEDPRESIIREVNRLAKIIERRKSARRVLPSRSTTRRSNRR